MIGLHQEAPAGAIAYGHTEHWNTTYQRTQHFLHDEGDQISEGLAKRLAHYGRKRLTDLGFGPLINDMQAHVSSTDIHTLTYLVEFQLVGGGRLGVEGIYTDKGWPYLDHGIFASDG